MNAKTVEPVARARFGEPQACPSCGMRGSLMPCFGLCVEDDGRRYPVIDPSTAKCGDCGETFKVAE